MTTSGRLIPAVAYMIYVALIAALLSPAPAQAAPAAAARMRPYAGIGVLVLPISSVSGAESYEPLQQYDEPAIFRTGELDLSKVPRHEWIFGQDSATLSLVVMARKAAWVKVVYDDAGREAWINPGRRASFQPWDTFFKGQTAHTLPGLQKKYYQLYRDPGLGTPLAVLTPQQRFKVILLEGDWAVVIQDLNSLSWVRWRDEDGRLLIGLERGGQLERRKP